jgi:hypothetical protein
MHERRDREKTHALGERTINKIGFIIVIFKKTLVCPERRKDTNRLEAVPHVKTDCCCVSQYI